MADIDEYSEERLREVGRYLARVREMHGLTQKQAALAAGMNTSAYLSVLESGKRIISLNTLEKLASAYGKVTLAEMVDHIGFTRRGKLSTQNGKVQNPPEEQASGASAPTASFPVATDTGTSRPTSAKIELLDAALRFIGCDAGFQMPPFAPRTEREKAMVIALYQQSSGRKLLTDDELRDYSNR